MDDDQLSLWNGDGRLRLIIFLSSGLCGGLPALVWAGWTVHQYRCLHSRNSILIITLLFNDAVELFLIPFIITVIASCFAWLPCHLIFSLFFMVRYLGLHFHQLVALEGILSLTHPRLCRLLSSVPCYTVLSLAMVTGVTLTIIFPLPALHAVLFVIPTVATITTCVLMKSVKVSPQNTTPRDRPDRMVLTVSLVSLLAFYGPSILTLPMSFYNETLPFPNISPSHDVFASVWETMSVSIMSLRVIADPLLCMLVCRIPRMQLSQAGEASD